MLAENLSREEIVTKYSRMVEPLYVYIPWLEKVSGSKVDSMYKGEGINQTSMAFPVYDSTLLNFVKQASKTELMNRNYAYIYSWNHLRNVQDELRAIEKAELYEMDVLAGILSRYVLGGMTKGHLWSEAVESGVFLQVLTKMKSLLEFWNKQPAK